MSKHKTSKAGFKELVTKIRLFDPAAAKNLNGLVGYGHVGFNYAESLTAVMPWAKTPQGHAYWAEVNKKVAALDAALLVIKAEG